MTTPWATLSHKKLKAIQPAAGGLITHTLRLEDYADFQGWLKLSASSEVGTHPRAVQLGDMEYKFLIRSLRICLSSSSSFHHHINS